MKKLEDYVVAIPDFPAPGIQFRDVTSVLRDADGFSLAVDAMKEKLSGVSFDAIAGLDARGFIFGAPLAYLFHKPFIPIRKKGKLPRKTIGTTCVLEYGTTELEIHTEDLPKGARVILVDDLIATGGTLKAGAELVEGLGATVEMVLVLIELKGLKGRDALPGKRIESIIAYEGK